MTKKILSLFAFIFLFGCVQELSKDNFIQKWEGSKSNSAVSWLYAGEDETYYYLVEKWPGKSNGFKISKADISLVDVEPFPVSKHKRFNLKSMNVTYKQ